MIVVPKFLFYIVMLRTAFCFQHQIATAASRSSIPLLPHTPTVVAAAAATAISTTERWGVVEKSDKTERNCATIASIPTIRRRIFALSLSPKQPDQWNFDDDDGEDNFEITQDTPTTLINPGVPTPRIPKVSVPKLDGILDGIDWKIVAKRFAIGVGTVATFVIIQKVGVIASSIVTPELSSEQVSNFRL